jgi:hypothetical protein
VFSLFPGISLESASLEVSPYCEGQRATHATAAVLDQLAWDDTFEILWIADDEAWPGCAATNAGGHWVCEVRPLLSLSRSDALTALIDDCHLMEWCFLLGETAFRVVVGALNSNFRFVTLRIMLDSGFDPR